MAAIDSYTKRPPQQKQQISDQKNDNPTKFYYNFLYKALTIFLFLIILPLFPSQAPEFVNQTLVTRSWELLHLVFVGIAISYGLFSRKNDNDNDNDDDDDENDTNKFDNAQNHVSRFLQVSSVFEEDSENPSASDENKVQTWSSQYMRNEPVVVVAQDSKKNVSKSVEKPLLLPVRSLKETSSVSAPVSWSNSRRFSRNSKTRNGEFGAFDEKELMEEKVKKESVVLPSPIPWRSRSGRMEMKEEQEAQESSEESHARFFLADDPEFSRLESRAQLPQSSRSSRPNSANSSPKISPSPSVKKLSPSQSSFSLESQGKIAQDMVKKRSFYNKTNPPPAPPPPPPPPTFYRSSRTNKGFERVSSEKEARKKVGFHQTFFKDEEDEEEEDLEEKVYEEFDQEETESEDDEIGHSFSQNFDKEVILKGNEESGSSSVGDEGPDVDKKADEFIAKFREQIRLQRIESIKRSTAQISRKLTR